jgi:predicted nucleotidyltransferase
MPAMYQMTDEKKARIAELCRRHHVRRLDLFGSAAGSDFDPSRSDLDVLVEFEVLGEGKYADAWFDLHADLEEFFGRKVDLVSATSVNNPYFRAELERTRRGVYAS